MAVRVNTHTHAVLAYSPMNPRAAVIGMNYVRDCHGDCIDASWFADGRCDDGVEVRITSSSASVASVA